MSNPRLLRYYSQELQHLREMGGEFAAEYPKIAGRLGLEGFDCADPYVERLLEGFAFMAARVQMKIDAEFPRFTQHLSELVYPHFLAPTPSMAIVQLQPDLADPALDAGYRVARGAALRSVLGKDDATACEYRTAHDVTLWPVELVEARFFTHAGSIEGVDVRQPPHVKAGLRLRLRTTNDAPFSALALDRLALHLRGGDDLPVRIYEKLLGAVEGVLVLPGSRPGKHLRLPKTALRPRGFDEDDALLPSGQRSFQGYRLLQEYFAFAQRFLFVELCGLGPAIKACAEHEIEIVVLLAQGDAQLEQVLDASHIALNCTPAVNLFRRRADRIDLDTDCAEYHVLADRTRPMDFEVHQVESVIGYGSGAAAEQAFQPMYTARDLDTASLPEQAREQAYYQVRREPRALSQQQRRRGPRSSYVGSETYISLVDARAAPYRHDLRQLGLVLWCTNRDLPLSMPLGLGKTDFILEQGGPVRAVRVLGGPSQPFPSFAEGGVAWRLINQLSLNYLSLVDTDAEQGARALRELLALYCHPLDLSSQRQVDGVRSVSARRVTRRLAGPGPIAFGRGLEITVTMDAAAFEGAGAFVLGAVLSHFFAQYVSINAFTETVVRTVSRGEIMRWPARGGACAIL
ncbi:type VI secretion system baseplate subunit TssF [Massilia sp. CFBP9026]|uniref:type VI secretion system baseplate subunit TssF n=1 Tax=Massilia sp. CFBP9026 TaxID=3096536 RepID=UPI002A69BF26|nr:type VI secretion system baseplate subunit TssF [Massilia sp. CFBP9026]MDY0965552.1 type VI secretion system baseplate subunit TssF [Massilia sp. CFBP9026]